MLLLLFVIIVAVANDNSDNRYRGRDFETSVMKLHQ